MSSHPSMQSAVSNIFAFDAAPAPGGTTAKLESRLLSSKTLSKEVNIVILSLHSALKPSEDEAEDDGESFSRSHELQIVDSSAASNQRGALEELEVNPSDSGDDSSGSSDSEMGSGSFQNGTSASRCYPAFDRNKPFSTTFRQCPTDSRNRLRVLADALKWFHSWWLRHRLE